MRVIVRFSNPSASEKVPVQNQSYLNYYVHKCLGDNNKYHNKSSDYSVSELYGGKLNRDKKTLSFINGGYIVITSNNQEFINDLTGGIMLNKNLRWGMVFERFDFIIEKFYNGWNHFATLSPFIIKKTIGFKKYEFVKLTDDNFAEEVKNHMSNKLKAIYKGINLEGFDVNVVDHPAHKVKPVMVKNCNNYANQCQVSFFCSADVAEKIYNLGLGQSTGSGFGTIYKTENHKKYRY